MLASTAPIIDLLRVAEVYKDSFRRRFRSGDRFGAEVKRVVRDAVRIAAAELGQPVQTQGYALADPALRRSLDYVVAIAGRPIVGIATVLQNQSGGRQQRDLSVTYPILQQKLADYGMALVLIADGQGMAEASDRTLLQLFESVRYPMTINQARKGALSAALIATARQPPPESLDAAAVSRLITSALDARDAIAFDELPLAKGPSILALARYAEDHRNLALKLSSTGESLGGRTPTSSGKRVNLQLGLMVDERSICLQIASAHKSDGRTWRKALFGRRFRPPTRCLSWAGSFRRRMVLGLRRMCARSSAGTHLNSRPDLPLQSC